MVKILQEKFSHLGLTFAIGGQISFDVFPNGMSLHRLSHSLLGVFGTMEANILQDGIKPIPSSTSKVKDSTRFTSLAIRLSRVGMTMRSSKIPGLLDTLLRILNTL